MNAKNFTSTCLLSLVAFSGSALAAGPMPAAGEGPLFLDQLVIASTLSRQDVRADAARFTPAVGELSAVAAYSVKLDSPSRATVRAETREAIAHGLVIKAGELS